MSRRIALVLFLFCGCAIRKYPHTTVEVPAPSASTEENTRLYQELRPAQAIMLPVLGGSAKNLVSVGGVRLMNGTEVFYPEDLRPMIPVDSPASLWLSNYEKENHSSKLKIQLGTALIFSSIGALAIGSDLSLSGGTLNAAESISFAVAVPGLISGAILYSLGRKQRVDVAIYREEFFGSYDASLLGYLHLCHKDNVVSDCNAVSPASQPTSQPTSTPSTNPTN